MHRYRELLIYGVMAAVFIVMFIVLRGTLPLVQLGVPAVLSVLAASGVAIMTSRTRAEISDDAYAADARQKVEACRRLVRQIEQAADRVKSPTMRAELERAGTVAPEVLERVEAKSPGSLHSSASALEGHLTSLLGVVRTFSDVERNPSFYVDAPRMLEQGERATRRFVESQLENIRLLGQGDMASYEANLATVAPPEMPVLGTKENP